MISHSFSKGGFNNNSILRVAPHVLTPPSKGTQGVLDYPALVHRLDTPTSGLLVLAKTKQASMSLSAQFADRRVSKWYSALLEGVPSCENHVIDYPIDKKPAITEWRELRRIQTTKGFRTLVEFRPLTGRKHQLRRHAVSCLCSCCSLLVIAPVLTSLNPNQARVLSCPIVGDTLYGSSLGKQLFLCANEIQVFHPTDESRVVHQKIDLPKHFEEFIAREEKRYAGYERWMLKEGIATLLELNRFVQYLKAQGKL
jgi:23S rRNA-/tRNA-specific pseudouridylate synthase